MAKTTSYNPYQEEIIGLERQRDTMRKIREEASAPMQGQMVSGWYVGPSWTQGLANMLRGYIGKRGEEKAEADIAERQAAQKTAYMGDMSKLAEIVRTGGTVDPGAFSTQEGQQAAMAQLVEANKPYNLGPGEKRFVGDRAVAAGDPKSAWAFSPPAFAGDPPKWVNKDTQQVRFQDPTGAIQTTSFALPPAQPPAGLAAAVRGPVAAHEPVVTTPLPAQAPITGQPLAAPAQPIVQQPILPTRAVEPAKAPTTRTRDVGDQTITEQWDATKNAWSEVSRAPRWQPKAGAEQKPLPATVLKQQDELLGQIATAETTNAQLDKFAAQIASNKLDLGAISNLLSGAQNLVGMSSESSRNFASFKAMMQKMRNDSLRLNSGVQTEGDAQRAWSELLENMNDPRLVQQRLAEIRELNNRAITERRGRIDAMRDNYGHAPYEPSPGRSNAPLAAQPPAGQPAPSRAQQAARPQGVGADWTLKQDAKGNKAWVSPDGKSFKEVK